MKKIIIVIILLIVTIISYIFIFKKDTKVVNNNPTKGEEMKEIYLYVNNNILEVELENNDATIELLNILNNKDITILANEYGGFEKVGSLGFELPANDKNIKTQSGDIVLYNKNQISVFYESNSWSYTKLGKIKNKTKNELKDILGSGNIELRLSIK